MSVTERTWRRAEPHNTELSVARRSRSCDTLHSAWCVGSRKFFTGGQKITVVQERVVATSKRVGHGELQWKKPCMRKRGLSILWRLLLLQCSLQLRRPARARNNRSLCPCPSYRCKMTPRTTSVKNNRITPNIR